MPDCALGLVSVRLTGCNVFVFASSAPTLFNFQALVNMRVAFAILLVAVIACACSTQRSAVWIPSDAPAVVFTDCRREHNLGFSEHEQALIGAARRYLERSEHRAIDAYYRVRQTFDGNEVIVMYVSDYGDGAQPMFGNYCVVLMREDGTIIRVFKPTQSHVERFKKTGKNQLMR